MLCAQFGVESAIEGHAGYLADWLTVLKSDKRFIFKASSAAARAVALLIGDPILFPRSRSWRDPMKSTNDA